MYTNGLAVEGTKPYGQNFRFWFRCRKPCCSSVGIASIRTEIFAVKLRSFCLFQFLREDPWKLFLEVCRSRKPFHRPADRTRSYGMKINKCKEDSDWILANDQRVDVVEMYSFDLKITFCYPSSWNAATFPVSSSILRLKTHRAFRTCIFAWRGITLKTWYCSIFRNSFWIAVFHCSHCGDGLASLSELGFPAFEIYAAACATCPIASSSSDSLSFPKWSRISSGAMLQDRLERVKAN